MSPDFPLLQSCRLENKRLTDNWILRCCVSYYRTSR